jgi:hypothetical protein
MSGTNRIKVGEVSQKKLSGKALEEALAKALNSQDCPECKPKKK